MAGTNVLAVLQFFLNAKKIKLGTMLMTLLPIFLHTESGFWSYDFELLVRGLVLIGHKISNFADTLSGDN